MNDILKGYFLKLEKYFNTDDFKNVTEVSMVLPERIWILSNGEWLEIVDKELSSVWIDGFSKQLASYQKQPLDNKTPILSTSIMYEMGGVELDFRIEFIIEPVVLNKTFSIRIPSTVLFSIDQLHEQGRFKDFKSNDNLKTENDKTLANYYEEGNIKNFLKCAIKQHRNILISGATGSGKTTISKAFIAEIPNNERIISLEDASELSFEQTNVIKLFFPSSENNEVKVTPKDLLASCMRLNPDRIILAEIRNTEAFHYINAISSGHSGITTVHANSAKEALERVTILIKQTEQGNSFEFSEITRLVKSSIDIVIHFEHRQMTDVYMPFMDKAL